MVETSSLFRDPRSMSLLIVFASVGIDFLGVSIVMPTLPMHLEALGGTKQDYGFMLSMYSIASVLAGFWMPAFGDKFGKRVGFLVSLAGSGTGSLFQSLAPNMQLFLAARCYAGLFGGSAGMAMAYISEVCTPAERPKYFPYVGTIIMLSISVGPTFGAGIATLVDDALSKGRYPMYFATGLAGVAFLLAYFELRDPASLAKRAVLDDDSESAPLEDAPPKEDSPAVASKKRQIILTMALISFLKSTTFNVYSATFAFYLSDELGLGANFFAFTATGLGMTFMINNVFVYPFLNKRFSSIPIGIMGAIGNALFTIFVVWVPGGWSTNARFYTTLLVLYLSMIGNGLIENIIPLVLADQANADNTARVLAVGSQAAWGGHIGGPVMYSWILEQTNDYKVTWAVGACFAVLAAFMMPVITCLERQKAAAAAGADENAQELTVQGRKSIRCPTLDAVLDQVRADVKKMLVEYNYIQTLNPQKHSPEEVQEAAKLIREMIAQSLPALPPDEGQDHIQAYNDLKAQMRNRHHQHTALGIYGA